MLGITLGLYNLLLEVCQKIDGTQLDEAEEDILSQEHKLATLEYERIKKLSMILLSIL